MIDKMGDNFLGLLTAMEDLKKSCNEQEMHVNVSLNKALSNQNAINELQNRSEILANIVASIEKEVTIVKETKQDRREIEEYRRKIDGLVAKMQSDLDLKTNQFNTVENFVEKYVPIRIQSQISETLEAVLQRSYLNRLENFEMEKYKQLNLAILEDDGTSNLTEIMRDVMK